MAGVLKYTGESQSLRFGVRLLKKGDTVSCSAAEAQALLARGDFEEIASTQELSATESKPAKAAKKSKKSTEQ